MGKRQIVFGHTADWHLTNRKRRGRRDADGVSIRLLDTVDNIRKMIRYLKHHKADFLLVAGDVFDSAPDETTRALFASILNQLLWSGIETVFTIGQHDIGRGEHFLRTFDYVLDEFPLEVGTVHVVDSLSSLVVNHGYDAVNIVVQPWERKIDPRQWRAEMDPECPNILMGHFGVLGGLMSDNFVADKGISPTDFQRFDYVALGDFHNPMQPYYSGSISRVTFAERDQPKGFRMVTMEPSGKVKKVELVDIHDRPYAQIDMAAADAAIPAVALQGDPVLKIRITGSADEVATFARMKEQQIRDAMVERGASDVVFDYQTLPIERESRMEGMEVGIGIEDAMRLYVGEHEKEGFSSEQLLEVGLEALRSARGTEAGESEE